MASASTNVLAGSGLGQAEDWSVALDTAVESALRPLGGHPPDLVVLFANDAYADAYPDLLRAAVRHTGTTDLVGSSASGVIGGEHELEGLPAISVLALKLPPGAALNTAHLRADEARQADAGSLRSSTGACTGLIVIADPYTTDTDDLIRRLEHEFPGATLVGGMASGSPNAGRTQVFAGTEVHEHGAVIGALSGSVALRAVVSQGAEPIGRPWTVTDVERNVVRGIGNRPAYEVLVEAITRLPQAERERVARNLLVGLAMDEYRDEFKRGDFLIRNVIGADPSTGAIAVGGFPRLGQTIQFQVRDARAADDELRLLLGEARTTLERPPAAALLFACNGRGTGLFGEPDHDVRTAREVLGAPPVAGLFCNGEIGPVGRSTFVHGFTASIGLFVER